MLLLMSDKSEFVMVDNMEWFNVFGLIFIVPLIIKSIFALNRKYNIGYHNDCNKNQPKNIKPFHIIYHHKLWFVFLFVLKMGNSDWNCPLIALIMRFFLACTDFCIKWCKFDVNRCFFRFLSNEVRPVYSVKRYIFTSS